MDFLNNVNWHELLQTYGYWAILLGTFLEGETIVILAGLLVANGHMEFMPVVLCAFTGTTLSDQLMFSIGKYKGQALLTRFPRLDRNRERASALLEKYDILLILGFRFIYGIRNVTPIVLGLSNLKHWRFLLLNIVGSSVWALTFTAAGYYFGQAIGYVMHIFGISMLGLVIVAALVFGGIYLYRRKRQKAKAAVAALTMTDDSQSR